MYCCLIIADNDNQQIMISNPADNSVSEISIDGRDGQGIHVRSTSDGIAEVTIWISELPRNWLNT